MRGMLATVAVLTVLATLGSVGTYALFTDQAMVGSTPISTGTIDLTATPDSAVLTLGDMVPGTTITNSLVVTNGAGSVPVRYAISATATDPDGKGLKDQLALTVKTVDVTTPATPCDDFDGTELYRGDLDSVDGKLVGDSAEGPQTGDRDLAVGASETLCFRVVLSTYTSHAYMDALTTAAFIFDAEQTANNP